MVDVSVDDVQIKTFEELTKRELYQVMVLRNEVFVVGQKITAEPEVDGLDVDCAHVLLRREGRLVATARIFYREAPLVVGRVAVHPDCQRQGLGTVVMRAVQRYLGERPAELHAQAHLETWYQELGWERFGEPFVEAEIEHVMMRWPASGAPA
ncbi:GNAT family N-acetyltransferase [Lujinxingia litoralis]|uniref:GNAT family N-acetyltransferase n=1 Tax=Lujinxingia litoralis TaxID=2211119 RepID=A0A328CCP1_9DELT|nr:GNAT family N-acetyltransferase [Lujinxingia litoralis]RAL25506.1 GNAT family N-acetyltransferase [Lujinxingia litoralis]